MSIQQHIPSADMDRLDELLATLGSLLNEARVSSIDRHDSTLREIVIYGDALYTPDGFLTFLTTPLREFDDRSALALIAGNEACRVLELLAADYDGLGY